MEIRKLGRTGLDVGVLGLGTEHLDPSPKVRDRILGLAVDAGVNYVDLLYVDPEYWHAFSPVLKPYRDRLVAAAHWGAGEGTGADAAQRLFDGLLPHLGGYAEVVIMTMVDSEEDWRVWTQASLERLHRYRAQGRIGHIGLSTHFAKIARLAIDSGLIEVLMFPVNMVEQHGEEGLAVREACAAQGVGLVAMKPYHGGTLFRAGDAPTGITPAQCLHYVLSQPVATTVPGPRTVEEMEATLHYLQASDEEKAYDNVAGNLHEIMAGQCVYCHHCLPCPEGIEIGWLLWLLDYARPGVTPELQSWYDAHRVKPSACTECGICMARCPYGVDIPARLRQAEAVFESTAAAAI
jgi:predicted aldo/keto reductase-like oxidoreductase